MLLEFHFLSLLAISLINLKLQKHSFNSSTGFLQKLSLLVQSITISYIYLIQFSLCFRYIDYAKNETNVRSQDYFTVLTYIARNPVGRPLVWNWLQDNWQYLVNR